MREVLQALLSLQEVDRDLYKVQRELKRLPEERAARKAELDKQSVEIASKKEDGMKLRVRIKEVEDAATQGRQRVRKVETESASARADMALLAAYQHEIKTLKREISASEDEALSLLERVDTLDATMAALQAKLAADQKVFEEFDANVQREMAAAEKDKARLLNDRKSRLSTKLPPEAVSDYTKLISARGGVAMAHLDGRTCQACYMEVPQNMVVRVMRGTELVKCPSCDRILYLS